MVAALAADTVVVLAVVAADTVAADTVAADTVAVSEYVLESIVPLSDQTPSFFHIAFFVTGSPVRRVNMGSLLWKLSC